MHPSFTFIEPPEFNRLRLELRTMGTGLIVEGPSKVGKSTAIRKAMEAVGIATRDQIWWYGQRPPLFDEFVRTLDDLLRTTRDTWLIIDDFHHLEDERYRRELASAMKVLADQPVRRAKVTLAGIHPLGNLLVQVMPDLVGRFRVVRLDIEKNWARSTQIQGELAVRFRAPMIEFAAFDDTQPPRGAGLSLLWLLARSGDGFVPVREARLRFPRLNAAFDWLLASNLTRCFQEHPRLQGLLYYNRAAQTLTMEDPQLTFYLRALNWEEFAAASGHGHVSFHPENGPLWAISATVGAEPGDAARDHR